MEAGPSLTRRTLLKGAMTTALAGWLSRPVSATGRWAWCGAVTARSARICVGANPRATVTLALSADGLPTTTLHVTADEYGVAGFILEGLQPATAYVYRLDGSPETSGTFTTFGDGPFSFRLAFASCASTGSNSKVQEVRSGTEHADGLDV
jgi:hypothetical protein